MRVIFQKKYITIFPLCLRASVAKFPRKIIHSQWKLRYQFAGPWSVQGPGDGDGRIPYRPLPTRKI